MCLSEHGAPNPPVAHHVFTNNCCFDLFWRYGPFSLTHTYTRNHDIVARRNNIIYNYGCMCVCESCTYLPLYPHKLVWLIPPYLRLHPMCINMIQHACFQFRTYVYIYIHTHTSHHVPVCTWCICSE